MITKPARWLISLFLVFNFVLVAQTPKTLSYQGVLKDKDNQPVTGTRVFIFALYDQLQSGSQLWTETQTLNVANGVFYATLGSVSPINLPFDKQYWLGIQIGASPELSPRIGLSSAPYSFVASDIKDGSITAKKIANNAVVRSINGLREDVRIEAGDNVVLSNTGNAVRIGANVLPGPKGDKGDTGPQGSKGDKGDKGDAGAQGLKGDKGENGAPGKDGTNGKDGSQGLKGDKGETGAQGKDGTNGKDGSQGSKGDKGDNGFQGLKGDRGDNGAQGLKGDKGDNGPQGGQGLKGDKGDNGPQGGQGLKGDKGDNGPQGGQGLKGDRGDNGAQGLKGDKGDGGAQGPPGLKGDKGDRGDAGPQGLKGDKGDKGEKGDIFRGAADLAALGPRGTNVKTVYFCHPAVLSSGTAERTKNISSPIGSVEFNNATGNDTREVAWAVSMPTGGVISDLTVRLTSADGSVDILVAVRVNRVNTNMQVAFSGDAATVGTIKYGSGEITVNKGDLISIYSELLNAANQSLTASLQASFVLKDNQ